MGKYTVLNGKIHAHSNIFLDRQLFRQPYAMSQHLFPLRVALIFGQDFALMTGEANHSFSPAHPKDL